MTTLAEAPATSASPPPRALLRRYRAPLALLLVLVVVTGVVGLVGTSRSGELDPRSYAPEGARAVATVLADQGVPTTVVGDVPELVARLSAGSQVVVPAPAALTLEELEAVGDAVRERGAALLVLTPLDDDLDALGVPATQPGDDEVEVRRPACALPAAERAGTARTGGLGFRPDGAAAVGCYATGGLASLLALPGERTTLLGTSSPLTNERVDEDGNAALALGLLGTAADGAPVEQVLWLLPRPDRPLPGGAQRSVGDLVPDALVWGVVQLGVAVAVLALWRARRLGRVVDEPLPVVVRAAEAVEGRSRLYRASGARDAAADALRAGARDRLLRRLGLPLGTTPDALVAALAARAGDDPVRAQAALFGPPPTADDGLVRLAADLDALGPRAS